MTRLTSAENLDDFTSKNDEAATAYLCDYFAPSQGIEEEDQEEEEELQELEKPKQMRDAETNTEEPIYKRKTPPRMPC